MTIRVLVNGANGKMGQETVKAISQESSLELVGQTGHNDDLAAQMSKTQPQVVIDFTVASVAYENTMTIINAGVHPVIGTTGFLPTQIQKLQRHCEEIKLGGIIAPNFSIGAVLLTRYAQDAVKYFPDVEIIELHHDGKEDSPSGTAIKTAEMLAQARNMTPPQKKLRETIPGARGANHNGIPIHAIRLPGLVAVEEVIFGGKGETLSIRHHSIHRESFMPGVILACKKVVSMRTLVYGLENIL